MLQLKVNGGISHPVCCKIVLYVKIKAWSDLPRAVNEEQIFPALGFRVPCDFHQCWGSFWRGMRHV